MSSTLTDASPAASSAIAIGPAVQKIPMKQIVIGQRHRKDMGDLQALARSIGILGLLQPIGVTSSRHLVWGERRLKACELLGWTMIDAVVDPSLDDILRAVKAEEDENTCRKPFTHTEGVTIADHIESIELERAKARKKATQLAGRQEDGTPVFGSAESAAPKDLSSRGETRQKVAAAVGMSHDTLHKARKVVATGTPKLLKAMDEGTASVNAAAEIAALPPDKQDQVVAGGKQVITSVASQIRQTRKQLPASPGAGLNACDIVAERWIKSIHDALVPVNSVRRDMGGGHEWAQTWDQTNLVKMANELSFVIGQYQQWLSEIQEVLREVH
jgi:ParB-like chromosome segregation protein Spo0J